MAETSQVWSPQPCAVPVCPLCYHWTGEQHRAPNNTCAWRKAQQTGASVLPVPPYAWQITNPASTAPHCKSRDKPHHCGVRRCWKREGQVNSTPEKEASPCARTQDPTSADRHGQAGPMWRYLQHLSPQTCPPTPTISTLATAPSTANLPENVAIWACVQDEKQTLGKMLL